MTTTPLTFVTGNPKKAEQLSRLLGVELDHQAVDLPEIQSLSLEEVVRVKAEEAYNILQTPVLVEDSSLTFHAMGKLPGTFIKWFLQELGNDGLCRIITSPDRSATCETLYGLHDGTQTHFFHGSVDGSIAPEPRGETTFGWDPVFIPAGSTKTRAEMTTEEADATSMRKIALEKLRAHLSNR